MTKNADSSQCDASISSSQLSKVDYASSRSGNVVFKSGHLFLSSKGIGWTSWKKRWFILTRTSLVFFRSDPNAVPQKGNEVNLILGGIDLNNSGSVIVKEDKKLITVLFPDGRDGRTFTLKAETLEDLHEWKVSLENALGQAPSAALMVGQNGIFRNGQADAVDCSLEQVKDKQSSKSLVLGRPILLALEDIDGAPSFLEKALRFIEEYGVIVEGILRQSASVDDVEHRIQEYEQGKMEFSPEEDSHVVADCIKYVLRELPSSPVPASCCNALLEAFRVDHGMRVASLRDAICETFPEPNRHLLQRVLMMMQTVASHKAENRMSSSAVAACMAPLLLRPLLAGDCELENDFDVGGDGSVQLLQAAAAANHAQAIVVTLLEEYDNIFGECSVSPILYSDSEDSGTTTSEDHSDDGDESFEDEHDDGDESFEDEHDDDDEDDDDDGTEELDEDTDDDLEHASSGSFSDGDDSVHSGFSNNKMKLESVGSSPEGSKLDGTIEASQEFVLESHSLPQEPDGESEVLLGPSKLIIQGRDVESAELSNEISTKSSSENKLSDSGLSSFIQKSGITDASLLEVPHASVLADRPYEPKNFPRASNEHSLEDDPGMKRLQNAKADLQSRLEEEAQKRNNLCDGLQRRKKELHERRLSLEQEVEGLQEKLHREVDLRVTLEAGLQISVGSLLNTASIDEKIRADLEEVNQAEAEISNLKHKFDDLELRLRLQREQNNNYVRDLCMKSQLTQDPQINMEDNPKEAGPVCVQQNVERSSKNKFSSGTGSSSSSSTSKKIPPRNEVINSTTSALSKLTTRLNFLKERRTQITTELQNMDKGRGTAQNSQSSVKAGKGLREMWWPSSQPMEGLSCPLNEKHRAYEPDNDAGVHEQQQQQDRSKKPDKARKSDSSNPQHDKPRSDGHQSKDPERSRGSDGPFASLWMNPR